MLTKEYICVIIFLVIGLIKMRESVFMKKISVFLAVLIALMCVMTACFETGTVDQGKDGADSGSGASNLGDFNVVIKSSRLAEDYQGNPVIIVKYEFTNNSDDSKCFSWSIDANAYQDGVELMECYLVDDSANYSSDNQLKEIKKGITLSVEVAYELENETSDVEVEVSELISFNDKKITKTFSID